MQEYFNCQLELVSTGVCRGMDEVPNWVFAKREWAKYGADGEVVEGGELRETTADKIEDRFGVRSRPRITPGQMRSSMFINAFGDAIIRARGYGVGGIRENVRAVFAASSMPEIRIPNYLENVCSRVGLRDGKREFMMWACSGFNHGVNQLSRYAETNPFEGYAVVGASEIWGDSWKEDNFDSILFGELAVVGIFRATPGRVAALERGIIPGFEHSEPTNDIVRRADGFLYMNGGAVMKAAPRAMVDGLVNSLELTGLEINAISKFIFHPGSKRVHARTVEDASRELGVDIGSRSPHYLADTGNNGSATNPYTLHRQIEEGGVKRESVVYSGSFGAANTAFVSGFFVNGISSLRD